MKKKIVGGIAIIVIVAIAAFNVNFDNSENGISNISLANMEALANDEGVHSNERIWERYYRSDGSGYNCTKYGNETC